MFRVVTFLLKYLEFGAFQEVYYENFQMKFKKFWLKNKKQFFKNQRFQKKSDNPEGTLEIFWCPLKSLSKNRCAQELKS